MSDVDKARIGQKGNATVPKHAGIDPMVREVFQKLSKLSPKAPCLAREQERRRREQAELARAMAEQCAARFRCPCGCGRDLRWP